MVYLSLIIKFWRESIMALLAILLLACLVGLNAKSNQIDKLKAEHKAYVQQYELVIAKAKADAAIKEKQWANKLTKAEQDYNVKIQQVQHDADVARTVADSLSKQLATAKQRLPTATRETIIEYSNTGTDILASCIEEYRTMAEAADRHAADARRLDEAWPDK
jgi:hypothetical protein